MFKHLGRQHIVLLFPMLKHPLDVLFTTFDLIWLQIVLNRQGEAEAHLVQIHSLICDIPLPLKYQRVVLRIQLHEPY